MPPAAPGVGCSSACDCPRAVLAPAPSQLVTVTSGSWATALAAASSILSGPRLPPGRSGGGASEFEDDLVICLLSDSVPCTCSKKGRVVGARQSLHVLLMRACSQMLAPPQSLNSLLCRWCLQSLRFFAPACAAPSLFSALRFTPGHSMLYPSVVVSDKKSARSMHRAYDSGRY